MIYLLSTAIAAVISDSCKATEPQPNGQIVTGSYHICCLRYNLHTSTTAPLYSDSWHCVCIATVLMYLCDYKTVDIAVKRMQECQLLQRHADRHNYTASMTVT